MSRDTDDFDGLDDLALLGFDMALLIGLAASVVCSGAMWLVKLPVRAWRALR